VETYSQAGGCLLVTQLSVTLPLQRRWNAGSTEFILTQQMEKAGRYWNSVLFMGFFVRFLHKEHHWVERTGFSVVDTVHR